MIARHNKSILKYLIIIAILFASTPVIAKDTENYIEVIQVAQPAGCNAYRELVSQYGWNVEVMMKIMQAESGCRSQVVNDNPKTKDFSVGLFQINIFGGNAKHRPSEEELKDAKINIEWAYKIYQEQGYGAWGVCRKDVLCYN